MMFRRMIRGFLIAFVGAGLLAGCVHTRPKPQVKFYRDGEVRQYKRQERFPEMDFFHHWVRKAYRTSKDSDFDFNREEQAEIIRQWGKPEYIRKPFKSLEYEKIEEWVYIEQQTVMQFVNHELVFEGPLTDFEQLLIRKGYPNHSSILIGGSGIERHSMVYFNWMPGRLESFNLFNGWMSHSQEGN